MDSYHERMLAKMDAHHARTEANHEMMMAKLDVHHGRMMASIGETETMDLR
jgi:hypothetical protein